MVKIVADTTSSLPLELAKQLGISLIPQIVIFGEEAYRDDIELDTPTFLQKLRTSPVLPKTAAPPPTLYMPIYQEAQKRGEEVVVVAPSARLSGTVRSAETAAQDFPDLKVYVVDTQTIAGTLASLVLMAHRWAQAGALGEVIAARLKEQAIRARTYFLVDTLEYLQKGGRIGAAKALLGELLQVKPILTLREGQVAPFEQQRTKKRAMARLLEVVEQECPATVDAHLCVMHIEAFEEAQELADALRSRLGLLEPPVIYQIPPAIVVHVGPGALALGFFIA
ncbi:MAG: DegV family protein [Anaerolineales bacterium]|nr:DegV family protein [Anaerolineales bacterium]MCX7608172.1 DegV family protein [Anaerolineales bacterium]MDW8226506.1 DegV family protein [Anaerolineales bacterium]